MRLCRKKDNEITPLTQHLMNMETSTECTAVPVQGVHEHASLTSDTTGFKNGNVAVSIK